MNIVVVNDFAHVNGGTAQVALASAGELARRGHRVTVFSAVAGSAGSADIPGVQRVCTEQEEIAADPNRGRAFMQGLWNRRSQRAMGELLHGLDRDDTIVHLHGWTKALSPSVIREAVVRGFPIVTTLHDYFCACPNGGFFLYPQQQHCHVRPLSWACVSTDCDPRNYPQKLWRVARQVVQQRAAYFPRATRHFISISEFSERILLPHLPSGAVVHRVPNPIEVPSGEPAPVVSNTGFLFVGRFSPEKGVVLLAAVAHELGVPVTFVGDGPLREAVAQACPSARFTGWLPKEQVREHVRAARALVLPSLLYETQGLVVGEAASQGVPAIVPRQCAASEFVVNGATGCWFDSGDRASLAAAMKSLHEDSVLAATMGKRAHAAFWADPPTLDRHVRELEQVYLALLRDSQSGRETP